MKLNEIAHPAKHQQIKQWLDDHHVSGYTINQDGTVDVNRHVILPANTTSIDVQFRNVNGNFSCNYTRLTSLAGAPQSVSGSCYCDNTNVVSLDGCPQSIGKLFSCVGTPLVKKHLLQLLKYKQIKQVYADGGGPIDKIINRHLQGDRDILACQDELIDAGFGDMARL